MATPSPFEALRLRAISPLVPRDNRISINHDRSKMIASYDQMIECQASAITIMTDHEWFGHIGD